MYCHNMFHGIILFYIPLLCVYLCSFFYFQHFYLCSFLVSIGIVISLKPLIKEALFVGLFHLFISFFISLISILIFIISFLLLPVIYCFLF